MNTLPPVSPRSASVDTSVEQAQMPLLRTILLGLVGLGTLLLLFAITLVIAAPTTLPVDNIFSSMLLLGFTALLVLAPLYALYLLRRGSLQRSVLVAAVGFTLAHGSTLIFVGFTDAGLLLLFMLPLTLTGLVGDRRSLLLVAGLSIGLVVLAIIRTTLAPPSTLPVLPPGAAPGGANLPSAGMVLPVFTIVVLLMVFLFAQFGSLLRSALANSFSREQGLRELRDSLEQVVTERTAALQLALTEAEARADEQLRLRKALEEQRHLIQEMSIPVLPVSRSTLVIPLVGVLDQHRLLNLNERALKAVEQRHADQLLLDITGVPFIDTEVARGLIAIAQAVRLLGASISLIGIRPEVAQTIVALGVSFDEFHSYANLQTALARVSYV